MRYRFIDTHKKVWPVNLMCAVMEVGRSGYYHWLKQRTRSATQASQDFDCEIRRIFAVHNQCYGAPRVTDELHDEGYACSKNRVARRMKALGLRAIAAKKFKVTTDSDHNKPVAPDLLEQNFTASRANEKWVSDLTYIWTDEGWLYLAVVMDLYSRAIIGWAMNKRMTQQLVIDALRMSLFKRGFPKGAIIHSDRGSQYCSKAYQKLIRESELRCSMGRRATCYDNAAMESFFHTLKVERVYRQRYRTRQAARSSVFEYIEVYYNRKRKHSAIGLNIPLQFEQQSA